MNSLFIQWKYGNIKKLFSRKIDESHFLWTSDHIESDIEDLKISLKIRDSLPWKPPIKDVYPNQANVAILIPYIGYIILDSKILSEDS